MGRRRGFRGGFAGAAGKWFGMRGMGERKKVKSCVKGALHRRESRRKAGPRGWIWRGWLEDACYRRWGMRIIQ